MIRTMGFRTIAIIAGLGGLLFGYDTGVISGALLYIRHSFHLSQNLQGLVVAITLGGAAFGAAVAGPLSDRLGRRIVLLVTALLFIVGALICAFAPGLGVLLAGRTIVGVAIGVASMLTPLYLSEMAPRQKRGAIVTINQIFVTVGLFLSYIFDYALTYLPQGAGRAEDLIWRAMLGVAGVPGVLLFLGMLILPESPRWLLAHGREDKARDALQRLRPNTDPSREFDTLREEISSESQGNVPWSQVFQGNARMPLIIGAGLAIFQQITGINTVIYFAPVTFKDSGIASTPGAILATAGIGFLNMVLTVITARLLDHAGRRKMLLLGQAGMFLSLLVLGVCFGISAQAAQPQLIGWVIFAFIAIYVGFFAIGLGPVFWLLISEIFPLAVRARGMSIATILNWLFNMLVSFTFLDLTSAIGRNGTFFLYAGLTAISIVFTFYLVPETKGRSLEQIEAKLHG
ncbi:sugar porter family MFS transporter [Acidocella sp.]|uniref:sugar porter family MFS transporter n=1 Tax=Acidocella sp. TaxID=50710 RepID=UPI00262B64EA|nr:sugar porter family MFS transporter [Acidocella sp.]